MSDLIKGLSGGWPFLLSWVFPGAIFWSVFALTILPFAPANSIFDDIAATSAANQALVLSGISLFTGVLLSAMSTVLYRILEGYYIPGGRLWHVLLDRQIKKRRRLQELISGQRGSGATTSRVRIGLRMEQLHRFPADENQFGPTRFANALRAVETYGWDRYRLDSQTFWSELLGVAPESLRTEEETARTPINFSVSMMFLSAGMVVLTALTIAANRASPALVTVALVSLVAVPVWYQLAVISTRYLGSVVQAMVNLGRVELAKSMGLTIPPKLEDEREMWKRLFWFVYEPFDEQYLSDLNSYRSIADGNAKNGPRDGKS
jgi:hypothetical protein